MALSVRPFDACAVAAPRIQTLLPPSFLDGSPIDLEIGCGVGWHPIQYAKAHPERRLIAIEHTREKFLRFERRARAHPDLAPCLFPVHADAIRWITHMISASSLDQVFILYPNPEPKAANKRWFRMPFFRQLLIALKPGAKIHLATNIASYALEAEDYASGVWNLKLQSRNEITSSPTPRTHFEKKYLARGETCFDLTFVKP
jgi:tRNA (guanine-N7-)-methyltransferase